MQLDAGRIGASGWPFLCKEKLFAEGGNFPSSGAGLTEDSVPAPPRAWSAVTGGLFLSSLRSDQHLLRRKTLVPTIRRSHRLAPPLHFGNCHSCGSGGTRREESPRRPVDRGEGRSREKTRRSGDRAGSSASGIGPVRG